MNSEGFKEEVWRWAEKIKVKPMEVYIRVMKKKWASCSSKGRLTFDTEVPALPASKRHEIIVHELLHLRYPFHNKVFQRMMERYLRGSILPDLLNKTGNCSS